MITITVDAKNITFTDSQESLVARSAAGYLAGKLQTTLQIFLDFDHERVVERIKNEFLYSYAGVGVIKDCFLKSSEELTNGITATFSETSEDTKNKIAENFTSPLLSLQKIFTDKTALEADELFEKTFSSLKALRSESADEPLAEAFAILLQQKLNDCFSDALTDVSSAIVERHNVALQEALKKDAEKIRILEEAQEKNVEEIARLKEQLAAAQKEIAERHHHQLGSHVAIDIGEATAGVSPSAAPESPRATQAKRTAAVAGIS